MDGKKQTKTKWGEDRGPLHIQGWIFVQTFSETIANWWNVNAENVKSLGVKSLGVTLDSCLTLNKHVSAVCSAASLHIKNIGKIRHLLTQSITEKLVHAFITACLDYCNSIMYGLPKRLIQRLQRIQNTAARLVTRTNRDDHMVCSQLIPYTNSSPGISGDELV